MRAVHFGACLLLESVFPLLFLVASPAWARADGTTFPARHRFLALLRRLLAICLLAGGVSGIVWFWLAAASMSGADWWETLRPGLLWIVLSQTQPGKVWLVRALLCLALAAGLPLSFSNSRVGWPASLASIVCALLSLCLTASIAWLGHAGAEVGTRGTWQAINDAIHLLTAGIWPAGLVPFALLLMSLCRDQRPACILLASEVTRRFSSLSVLAVALLSLSGAVNSYLLVGSWSNLIQSDYGRVLLLKLSLFAVAICFGGANLLGLKRKPTHAGDLLADGSQGATLAKIARNVWIEIVMGALILMATAWLGVVSPPHNHGL